MLVLFLVLVVFDSGPFSPISCLLNLTHSSSLHFLRTKNKKKKTLLPLSNLQQPESVFKMKSFEVHEGVRNENPTHGFSSIEGKDQIWFTHDQGGGGDHQEEDLLDVSDASMFYTDFPTLPDFPCMSQSSSSSSTPAPTKPLACTPSSSSTGSSSSAASWAVLKSDAEDDMDRKSRNHDRHDQFYDYDHRKQQDPVREASTATLSSTGSMDITETPSDQQLMMEGVDCMDVMENLGYMDLLENTDFFDPSSVFQHDEIILDGFQLDQKPPEDQQQQPPPHDGVGMVQNDTAPVPNNQHADDRSPSDDLAMLFLEWLKSNKEMVSAEDLRKIKIKKSTIECAARRLGGGKEAMKQLLKLILEWVKTNHLERRRLRESSSTDLSNNYHQEPIQSPNPNPPPPLPDHSSAHPGLLNQWIPPAAPYVADPGSVLPGYPPMGGYMGDPYGNGAHPQAYHHHHMLDPAHSWPMSQLASHYSNFGDSNLQSAPANTSGFPGYGNQYNPYHYPPGHGEGLVRLGSSATKEARKKRMARQRRFLSHDRTHNNSQHNQNRNQENDSAVPAGNWVYWHTGTGTVGPMDATTVSVDHPATQCQKQGASDRRQGWKPEKNLRFLLQKVLKQSDVGSLGRIVLPKKEAETHLPELDARDGISIAMEDIGTSKVWNMRYRFWPNNKSRMYLLENTGDFVKANGLQEGDFIVIYSDVKCGKYLIRGVKVRQAGPKTENKRGGKSQKNSHNSSCGAGANNAETETIK